MHPKSSHDLLFALEVSFNRVRQIENGRHNFNSFAVAFKSNSFLSSCDCNFLFDCCSDDFCFSCLFLNPGVNPLELLQLVDRFERVFAIFEEKYL